MNNLAIMSKLKELIDNNVNIIEYLKKSDNRTDNNIQDIMISYELQTGSYTAEYYKNKKQKMKYINELANIFNTYCDIKDDKYSLLEAGIGEGTTLGPLLMQINHKPYKSYGFDLSWSRVFYANKFLRDINCELDIETFCADLFNIPIKDNSIDIVYTSHSIEPNGGREREALQELYRITNQYLFLFEPSYELASEEARERMKKHGYITNLYNTALELKYNVIEYKLLEVCSNPLNPTGVMIIKKERKTTSNNPYLCPVTHKDMEREQDCFNCKESMLVYPIIKNIPCLFDHKAIIATKYND